MIGGLLAGLVIGMVIGYFLGRRAGESRAPKPDHASIAVGATVTKRGRKAGLRDEDFAPSDDILIRMHEAWERGEEFDPLTAEPAVDAVVPPSDIEVKASRVLARLEGAPAGEEDEVMPQEPAPEAAPGGETVSEAMTELAAMGYGDDLRLDGVVLRCCQCEEAHDTREAEVEHVRRFEGQSDPADEAIVLALRCPRCGAGGLLVSSYGPDADPALAEAFTYLASRAGHG